MRISVLIIVSLALNVMLAAVWFHQSPGHPATTSGPETMENSGETLGKTAASTSGSTAAAGENPATPVAGKVSWRDLTSPDLALWIRKLRAAGCPETTIQDLVLAEVNRRFAAKTRALWQQDPNWLAQSDYWKPYQRKQDPEQAKKNRERYKAQQAAQKEKSALLVELFGFDVEKQRMRDEGYDPDNWNYAGASLSFLPESKRAPVEKYLDDFQDKMQEFYASVSGSWGPEERAKQKELEAEKMAGLAQFLTPQELREYELRNSQTAQQITSDLHGVDITREQYEALFDIRQKYGDSIYNYGDADNTPAQIKQIEQNKKDMDAEIAVALGPDKGAELLRAQDYSYQQLKGLARRNDLPADTANKVYDYKTSAEKAVEALNTSQDLTPEQRQAALQQIRTETEASIKTALGDKLFQRYKNNGGWWINQLGPAQPK